MVIEKERNMTVGKVQARSGKLPSHAELEKLAREHPEPPPMGEVITTSSFESLSPMGEVI